MSDAPFTDLFFREIEEDRRRTELNRAAKERRFIEVEEGKQKLLADPSLLHKAVADVTAQFSPSAVAKPKPGKFLYDTDAVESVKSEDDPTVGMAPRIAETYRELLARPELRGKSKEEILSRTIDVAMNEGEKGNTLLERTYRYKRAEDAGWFSDTTKDIPGYRTWLEDTQAQEKIDEKNDEMFTAGNMAIAVGAGAVVGGMSGGPIGAALGALTGAAGELLAAPARKQVRKTEWYRGQMTSDSWTDKIQALAGEGAVDMGLGAIATKGVLKGLGKVGDKAFRGLDDVLKREPTSMFDGVYEGPKDVTNIRLGNKGFYKWENGVREFVDEAEIVVPDLLRKVLAAPTARNLMQYDKGMRKLLPFEGTGKLGMPQQSSKAMPAIDALLQGAETTEEIAAIKPVIVGLVNSAKRGAPKRITAEAGKETPAQALMKIDTEEGLERAFSHPAGPAYGAVKALDDQNAMVYLVDDAGRAGAIKKWKFELDRKLAVAEKPVKEFLSDSARITDDIDAYDEFLRSAKEGRKPSDILASAARKATEASPETVKGVEDFVAEAGPVLERELLADAPVENLVERLPQMDTAASVAKVIPKGQIMKEIRSLTKGLFDDTDMQALDSWLPKNAMFAANSRTAPDVIKAIMKTEGVGPQEAVQLATGWRDAEKIAMGSKYGKFVAGLAYFGVGLGAIGVFNAETADASIWSSIVGAATKEARYAAMETLMKKGLISKTVEFETEMGAQHWQRGMKEGVKEAIKGFKGNISNAGSGMQFGIVSPYQGFEAVLKTGSQKTINPAVFLASHVAAAFRNTSNATKVVNNILAEAGVKTVRKEVQKAMDPIADLAIASAKYDVTKARIGQLEKQLETFNKKMSGKLTAKQRQNYANDVAATKDKMAKLAEEEVALKGSNEKFVSAYEPIVKDLAAKHASVRISLLLDDTKDAVKYPWLKGMVTYEDKVAAGKIRKLLDQYQVRLAERKVPVIKDGYFPHAPHPLVSNAMYARMAENEAIPGVAFAKFYSRTINSRPLMPDVTSTMEYYLRDVEKRIQFKDFWKGPDGWKKVMLDPTVQANYGLKKAFQNLYEGSKPAADTWGNRLSNGYTEFEVFKRLFLNPSAGLKHAVKVSADFISAGGANFVAAVPQSLRHMARTGTRNLPASIKKGLRTLGVNEAKFSRTLADDFVDSMMASSAARSYMLDLGIENQDEIFSSAKQMVKKVNNFGAMWINGAEFFDRSMSINSALTMSIKKGMTVDQALYGGYDLILKNNFLGGEFNSKLMNNPKFRALMMFQATPMKIFERRLVNAYKTGRSMNEFSRGMKKIIKDRGWEGVIQDFKEFKSGMYAAESEVKANLFADTLFAENDFFGTPIFQQTVRDVATIAAATYAGHSAGLSLYHHFFHIPYLSTQTDDPTLAFSPGVNAVIGGVQNYMNKDDPDFVGTEIMKKWLGPYGPFPEITKKMIRLSENDIPEIYQKGGGKEHLKYFFSVPGYEK